MEELKLYELYYIVLVDNLHEDDLIPYDMEIIWNMINNYYFKERNEKLDINLENDRSILFYWLRDKSRYQLLDHMMLQVVNRFINKEDINGNVIDNRDNFFLSNIDMIYQILFIETDRIVNDIDIDLCKLSTINKKDTINMVKDILLLLDPNGEWLYMYEDILERGKIIYLNELDSKEEAILKQKIGVSSLKYIDNSYLQLDDNESYIFLRYTNTIKDVPTTIHEIIHYIIRNINEGKVEIPILREFPSIFYEMYAINYLEKLGYSKKEIDVINYDRLIDTYMALKDMLNILYYLHLIIDESKINEENDSKFYNSLIKTDILEIDNDAKARADKCIYDLVINPYLLHQTYPYITGDYLANEGIKKIKTDDNLLPIIKYITENITNIDPVDIFNLLGANLENINNHRKLVKIRDK